MGNMGCLRILHARIPKRAPCKAESTSRKRSSFKEGPFLLASCRTFLLASEGVKVSMSDFLFVLTSLRRPFAPLDVYIAYPLDMGLFALERLLNVSGLLDLPLADEDLFLHHRHLLDAHLFLTQHNPERSPVPECFIKRLTLVNCLSRWRWVARPGTALYDQLLAGNGHSDCLFLSDDLFANHDLAGLDCLPVNTQFLLAHRDDTVTIWLDRTRIDVIGSEVVQDITSLLLVTICLNHQDGAPGL